MVTTTRRNSPGSADPFLEELISARRAKGWTQETLADVLGLSRTFVAMVETGGKKPSEETARLWAEKLDLDHRKFQAWVRSQQYGNIQEALTGYAEYRYMQDDPHVTVRVVDNEQIGFESGQRQLPFRSKGSEVERVPLIPEGVDPDSNPGVLDYVTVQRELLQDERLVRPFAYRLSAESVARVGKTLKPGDYAIISRDTRPLQREEIYAVRSGERIVLSRIIEKGDMLLMFSDQGEQEFDALHAEGGKVRSLIVGKVVAAIRPLQYSVVKPGGRKSS
jgi:transcriptional regulator with XRE-family HTH domain